jgi:phosphoglycolate phosphatase
VIFIWRRRRAAAIAKENPLTQPTILFDLDGTLTDSRAGIFGCLHRAMRALGHAMDETEDLTWAIGPPTEDMFARLLAPFGDTDVDRAVTLYRRCYDERGWRENTPYDGIGAALDAFAAAGMLLFVATSKRVDFARRIVTHFGFGQFQAVYGAEPGRLRSHKPELIGWILQQHGIDPARAVMIGDRSFDITGAHANRLRAIGVTWGYGTRGELEQAGADGIAESPDELLGLALALCRHDRE